VSSVLPVREVLRQTVNEPLTFTYEAESDNGEVAVEWTVTDSSGSISAEQSGTAFSYAWPETGVYTVRAQAADPMGLVSEQRWSVTVTDPDIAVTYPEAGKSYSMLGMTAPVVDGRDIVSAAVYLDGSETPVSADFDWSSLSAGEHTIQAAGTYYIISSDAGPAEQTVESPAVSFSVRELAPPTAEFIGIASGDTVLADVPYTAAVDAAGAEGRDIASVNWTLNGSVLGEGTEIEFSVPERGRHTLRAEVTDTAGMTKLITAELTAVDPSLQITLPTLFGMTGTYPSDTPITMKYSGRDVENVTWILEGSPFSGRDCGKRFPERISGAAGCGKSPADVYGGRRVRRFGDR